ncbi:MAG: peptide deformylase [Candidatus Gastranaerophilaceae bacterium]
MSIRKILKYGDPILRQRSKEITKISKKIQVLAEDMLDTMYANNGVGLAAPQVGELLRLVVIDVSTGKERYNPIILVNPKIIKKDGAVACSEGCLSFPDVYTDVRRYKNVTVKALDLKGKPFIIEGKDGELLARALQHEFDHLDGVLFVDHVRNRFEADKILEEKGLPHVEPEHLIDESEMEEIIAQEGGKVIDKVEENND